MINYGHLTTNVLLHVIVMTSFLIFFFFVIASKIEKNIVDNQIQFLIDEFVGQSFSALSEDKKAQIKSRFKSILNDNDLVNQDNLVKENNKKIENKAIKYLSIFVSILIIIIIIIGFIYKWDFNTIKTFIIGSVISLFFIAITEFVFMYFIARNYISTDPNKIREKIIETLHKSSQQCTLNNNCTI